MLRDSHDPLNPVAVCADRSGQHGRRGDGNGHFRVPPSADLVEVHVGPELASVLTRSTGSTECGCTSEDLVASADTRLDPEHGLAARSAVFGRRSCRPALKRRRETSRSVPARGRFGVHEMAFWQVDCKLPRRRQRGLFVSWICTCVAFLRRHSDDVVGASRELPLRAVAS